MYLSMAGLTLGSVWLEGLWSGLAGASALIVALGFMLLPTEWLSARGESPIDFGIGGRSRLSGSLPESSWSRIRRSTRQALKISLLILPAYWVATHLWHQARGEEATWHARALARWSDDVRGFSDRPLKIGQVALEARADRVKVRWRLRAQSGLRVEISSPSQLDKSAQALHITSQKEGASKTAAARGRSSYRVISKSRGVRVRSRATLEISAEQSGWVNLNTRVQEAHVSVWVNGEPLSQGQLLGGASHSPLAMKNEGSINVSRGIDWLWSLLLIQLFMVGLPEEIFYRGYIQTRLDSLIGRDRSVFGVPFNWASATLCSLLFAIAHLITIPHPARLAVFFPSLLFGWMRRAYHDTLPPAIFHALCNVSAQISWGIYALS